MSDWINNMEWKILRKKDIPYSIFSLSLIKAEREKEPFVVVLDSGPVYDIWWEGKNLKEAKEVFKKEVKKLTGLFELEWELKR